MSIDTQPAAQAVEALIHQYGRLVFRVIYGLTGDWHESQDLTQDTFVAAFKAIEAARQASSANFHAKAWLMQFFLIVTEPSVSNRTHAPKCLCFEQTRNVSCNRKPYCRGVLMKTEKKVLRFLLGIKLRKRKEAIANGEQCAEAPVD